MDRMQRFAEGDLEAFESVFREFQGRIYASIVRLVRDRGAAEDLTVEAFWRIYRSRHRFNPEYDFGGWAYRIAVNAALSYLRQHRPVIPWYDWALASGLAVALAVFPSLLLALAFHL